MDAQLLIRFLNTTSQGPQILQTMSGNEPKEFEHMKHNYPVLDLIDLIEPHIKPKDTP